MSYKNLNDLQYLYEGVVSDSQTDELSEAVLYTVVTEMVYRGYSEFAINQYLGNISEVELIERFLSTFEIENLTLSEQQEEKRALILERPNLGGILKLIQGGSKVTLGKGGQETIKKEAAKRGPTFVKKVQNWLSNLGKGNKDKASKLKTAASKEGDTVLKRPNIKNKEFQTDGKFDQSKYDAAKKKYNAAKNNTSTTTTKDTPKIDSNVAKTTAVVGGSAVAGSQLKGSDDKKNNNKKVTTAAPVTDKDKEDAKKESDLESVTKASGKYKEVDATGKGNEEKTVLQKVKDSDPKDNKLDPTPVKKTEVKVDKVEKQPEVKTADYIGKAQGLLDREKWLAKTANSPAANAGLSKDQRWAAQEKHRKWQQDNNRGAFKVKNNPDTSGNEAKEASKAAALSRRNAKLVDKGLKPPKSSTPKNFVETNPKTHYTSKIGAFLNNKKKGDLKGTGKHTITKIDHNYEEYDAYDLVLNYIMESKQASSIEEANYIMIEMDQNTIHEIVQAQKKTLSEGPFTTALALSGAGALAAWGLPKLKKNVDKKLDDARKNMTIGGENRKKKIENKTGVNLDNW